VEGCGQQIGNSFKSRDFDSGIHAVLGLSPADFEGKWKAWAKENRQLFG
jgi:hypothetical protein